MTSERTDDELGKALYVLGYEVWMTAESCARLEHPDIDDVTSNALLEAVLVHARNVMDCLNPPPSALKRDITIRDFGLGHSDLDDSAQASLASLELIRTDVNRHLAHLTWERVTVDAHIAWTPRAVAESTSDASRGFALAVESTVSPLALRHLRAHNLYARQALGLEQ